MDGVALARHESALGTWVHAQWSPSAGSPLREAIDRIWYFEGRLEMERERVFPDGTLELIVQLDTPHRPGVDGAVDRFPPICVTGLRTTAEVVAAPPGRCRVVGLRLKPLAATRLLQTALPDLTGRTIDLHDVLGRAAAELGERVSAARDARGVVEAATNWAAQRLIGGADEDRSVRRALKSIVADAGTHAIATLDAWEGHSRSRFTATFRDHVGVTPKRFARILRFNNALTAINERLAKRDAIAGRAMLGDIALAAGYYDQAHFTSEFRMHAGLTPGAYLRAAHFPGATSVAEGAEQFFQDAAG